VRQRLFLAAVLVLLAGPIYAGLVLMAGGRAAVAVDPLAAKWEPGNYQLLLAGDSDNLVTDAATLITRCNSLAGLTNVKGMMIRVEWADLESTQGSYDFSPIGTLEACLRANDQHLWVMTKDRTFGGGHLDGMGVCRAPLPQYVKDLGGTNNGCAESKNGSIARTWRADVMNRWLALLSAFCVYAETLPNLHGITDTESVPGFQDVTPPADYSDEDLFEQLERVPAELVDDCVTTTFLLQVNFPVDDDLMISLVDSIVAAGGTMGIGAPDVYAGNWSTAQEAYMGMLAGSTDQRGKIPAGFESQPAGVDEQTLAEIKARAVTLGNHLNFWPRKMDEGVAPGAAVYWPDVLVEIEAGNLPTVTTCPTNFPHGCAP
jgi:hypothetical protein